MSAILLISCSGTENFRSPAVNYDQYRTYNIGNSVAVSNDNPVFKWPQLSERVQKALHFHLPSAGLDSSPAGTEPDLLIYFYVISDAEARPPIMNYKIGWKAEPFLAEGETFAEYNANTLVLDFVDAAAGELVWRRSIHLPLDDEEQAYKKLSKRIQQLVKNYPDSSPGR